MSPKVWRTVPAAFVVLLLVLVVRAQPPCEPTEIPRTATYQPLGPVDFLVARQVVNVTLVAGVYSEFQASLGPSSGQAQATLVIAYDDPLTERPTTQTPVLHVRRVAGAAIGDATDFELSRPIVIPGVTGTAQIVPSTAALYVRIEDPAGPETFGFAPDAAVSWTGVLTVRSQQGPLQVPGPNPRLAFTACLLPVPELRVLQQVVTIESSPVIVFGETEIAQEFTVPVTSTAQWIELVSRSENGQPPTDLAIEIFEIESSYALGYGGHHATPTATLLRAAGQGSFEETRWMASDPFGFRPWLHPGRLYVLRMRIVPQAGIPGGGVAFLGSAFEDVHPGKLYMRYAPTDPPFEVPSDLSFRLIGTVGLDDRTPEVPVCEAETYVSVTATATIEAERIVHVYDDEQNRPLGSAAYAVCTHCATLTATLRLVGDGNVPIRTDTYPLDVIAPTGTAHGPWMTPTFTRPLVTRPVTRTIDTTNPGIAADFLAISGTVILGARATPTGTSHTVFRLSQGAWEPVAVSASAVLCGVSEPDGTNGSNLRILQQVVTVTDPAPESDFIVTPTSTAQLVQYFTLPVTATVDWLEVAVGGLAQPAPPLAIRLYDALAIGMPPQATFPPTSTTALSTAAVTTVATWYPSGRFPSGTSLRADHPYALVAEVDHAWILGTHGTTLTGQLFQRNSPGAPFQPVPGRTLSYRIIGVPAEPPTDVRTPFESNRFALRIGPNPASARFALSWAGGAGRAAVDITDVRGRRVLQLRDVGAATAGSWTWEGRDAHGRSLPAGVYFVRMRDAQGGTAAERVVLLR